MNDCQGQVLESWVTAMADPSAPQAATAILREVFGYDKFRTGQGDAIVAAMAGRDAVVLLPTGGGKSLCYQVPAIAKFRAGAGTTIVISPLIALMNDQVAALAARGIAAAALHSHQEEPDQRKVVGSLLRGELALLYVSPERAALASFHNLLGRVNVALLAIDEAHCVSQWGHDFRPEYMQLHRLRDVVMAPVVAVTATATTHVMGEVIKGLALRNPLVVSGDFRRPNLAFAVVHESTDQARFAVMMERLDAAGLRSKIGSGRAIVYCSTRNKVESVAETLKSNGFAVGYYHAGRTALARERAERSFAQKKTRVLVATNAFGMGVDYPDVRLVVHFQAPASLEAYYQEAGRAGRDGEPGSCLMMFAPGDIVTHRRMQQYSGGSIAMAERQSRALAEIERYANDTICRQKAICEHFTANIDEPVCGQCDACLGTVWASQGVPEAPAVGRRRMARGSEIQRTNPRQRLPRAPRTPKPRRQPRASSRITGVKFDLDLYRKKTARQLRWKPYMVFQQATIVAIDAQRPTSEEALLRIPGLGPAKIARFGKDILAIVQRNRQ